MAAGLGDGVPAAGGLLIGGPGLAAAFADSGDGSHGNGRLDTHRWHRDSSAPSLGGDREADADRASTAATGRGGKARNRKRARSEAPDEDHRTEDRRTEDHRTERTPPRTIAPKPVAPENHRTEDHRTKTVGRKTIGKNHTKTRQKPHKNHHKTDKGVGRKGIGRRGIRPSRRRPLKDSPTNVQNPTPMTRHLPCAIPIKSAWLRSRADCRPQRFRRAKRSRPGPT